MQELVVDAMQGHKSEGALREWRVVPIKYNEISVLQSAIFA